MGEQTSWICHPRRQIFQVFISIIFHSQVYTLHELSRHTSMMGLISTLGQELIALVIDDFGGNTFRQRRFA